MSSILILICLALLQLVTGIGVLSLCRIFPRRGQFFSLALLCGVAVFSIIPFLLQLCFIPITTATVFLSLGIAGLLLNLKSTATREYFQQTKTTFRFTIKIYELPHLLVITGLLAISIWRCFYLPPAARDFTSGTEVLATYAIPEETMINSVFSVNLESTNNPFKSPFLTSLQVIYKLAGFPFGQVWLSGVVIAFIIFLYNALRKTLHPVLAGILMVTFLVVPEMFAYTYLVLYDYTNAVFFFLSCYFLFSYFENRQFNYLFFSALLMGIAVYIRSETLVLAGPVMLLLAWHYRKSKYDYGKMIKACGLFLLPAVVLYLVSITLYLNYYLPLKYDISNQINNQLLNFEPLLNRFMAINSKLIFSTTGVVYYGYFIFLFLVVLLVDIPFSRKINAPAINWLIAVGVIYVGYPVLGYLLPLLDIDNSTKRGLFKLFPLMLLYMANTNLLIQLSEWIYKWEKGSNKIQPAAS